MTQITHVGNLTADPELRFTGNGVAFTTFTVANTPRVWDKQSNEYKDGEPLFLRCTVWREHAENVAQSLKKGMRVVAVGELKQRTYETKEGEKRTSYDIDVQEVAPSLKYATASVTGKAKNNWATPANTPAKSAPAADGWATTDEVPF